MADARPRKAPVPIRLEVLRTEWPTPHMVRVTLGGDGLDAYVDNEFTDRYVKLLFPRPGVDLGGLGPVEARTALPPELRPVTRTYTVRSYDPVARELSHRVPQPKLQTQTRTQEKHSSQ